MVRARLPRSRRSAAAILVGGLALAAPAAAQPTPAQAPPVPTTEAAPAPAPPPLLIDPTSPTAPAVPTSTGAPPAAPLPGSVMRRPERLSDRPSGFWTSNRPAEGGAYRWRIMAVAGAVLALSVFFVARMLRRISRQRALAGR